MGRMKVKELVGARVRVNRKIELRSGVVVKPGTIAIIGGTWRGRFTLVSPDPPRPGYARDCIVRHVHRHAFDVVDDKKARR